jgi:hypothetical protein
MVRELADGTVGEVRAPWRPDQVLRRGPGRPPLVREPGIHVDRLKVVLLPAW